uniref:Uncharacterized protein n=1 Tax=Sipha flava TaxID=143950 RepID=A0A2S2QNK2_9HEMI
MYVFPSFVAIFQLYSVVWCHQPVYNYKQTKYFRKLCHIQNEKDECLHNFSDSAGPDQFRRIANEQLVAAQRGERRQRRETPEGCGLYRDPLEVLGNVFRRFSGFNMSNFWETNPNFPKHFSTNGQRKLEGIRKKNKYVRV